MADPAWFLFWHSGVFITIGLFITNFFFVKVFGGFGKERNEGLAPSSFFIAKNK